MIQSNEAPVKSLKQAATKIVNQCLRVTRLDTVTIIFDQRSLEIVNALKRAVDNTGARVCLYELAKRAKRPLKEVPASLLYELKRSQMTIFVDDARDSESSFRRSLVDNVDVLRVRHAHIINMDAKGLTLGMRADTHALDRLNQAVKLHLRHGKSIRVTSENGTDVAVKISPRESYMCLNGEIRSDRWENLPSGEVAVAPSRIDGVFVCDRFPPGVIEYEPSVLEQHPLRMEFKRSRVSSIQGGPENLAARVEALLRAGTNRNRIGGLVVGTNYLFDDSNRPELGLEMVRPGVSFCFGLFPAADPVMVRWESDAYFPFTSIRTSLEVDGAHIIKDGKFASSVLEAALDS